MTAPAELAAPTTAEKLNAIIEEVGTVVFERDEVTRLTVLTLLANLNILSVGPPGAAKTEGARLLASHITDAKTFVALLHATKPPETLLGRLNGEALSRLEFVYDIDGNYLPSCHVAIIDEVWRGNSAVHDPMLSILNRDGFDNGPGGYVPTPLMLGIGLSNSMPEDDASMALYDRFAVRTMVDYIADTGNFMSLLSRVEQPYVPQTTVTVGELATAVAQAAQVTIGQDVLDSIARLRAKIGAEGHRVSDRRWRQGTKLLRAAAYLEGRSAVDEDDLEWLRFMLWETPEQIDSVTKLVLQSTSAETQVILAAIEYAKASMFELKTADGQQPDLKDKTPEADEKRSEFSSLCAGFISKSNKTASQLETLKTKLAANGRSTARIDDALARIGALKREALSRGLGEV